MGGANVGVVTEGNGCSRDVNKDHSGDVHDGGMVVVLMSKLVQ